MYITVGTVFAVILGLMLLRMAIEFWPVTLFLLFLGAVGLIVLVALALAPAATLALGGFFLLVTLLLVIVNSLANHYPRFKQLLSSITSN